uniref:Uncharacterized protein n=1 Tax=Anguilla anguilla TaxID=7936 RepID=A0A0E9RN05_ANGAN
MRAQRMLLLFSHHVPHTHTPTHTRRHAHPHTKL